MAQRSEKIVKAKEEVINVTVKNLKQETLGEIEEIVLNKQTGQALYLVLECGGVLGIGSKLFALPWKAIHYDTNEDCFIANIDKELLKNAKGFDKNNWPDAADTTFAAFETEKSY